MASLQANVSGLGVGRDDPRTVATLCIPSTHVEDSFPRESDGVALLAIPMKL